jgi:phosphoglycolate phosphatase
MPALVIFDLDGTLIDSLRDLTDSANELLASYGAAPLEEAAVGRMVGEGAGVLVSRLLTARGLDVPHADALARYLSIYDRRLLEHTRPYDGIEEALARLADEARMGVLTNKPAKSAERILVALRLRDRFEWVVGGDSTHGRKPAPGGLHWIRQQAGASPAQTVMVGDSVTDVLTARAAGVRACVAQYGFGFANIPAGTLDGTEILAAHPSQLPERLHAAFSRPESPSVRRGGPSGPPGRHGPG